MIEQHMLTLTKNVNTALIELRTYMQNTDCKDFTLDLSFYNLIDSTKLAAMAMTLHFLKYTTVGTVKIVVVGNEEKHAIERLKLRNSQIVIATDIHSAKTA